jgi:hypothetical protein
MSSRLYRNADTRAVSKTASAVMAAVGLQRRHGQVLGPDHATVTYAGTFESEWVMEPERTATEGMFAGLTAYFGGIPKRPEPTVELVQIEVRRLTATVQGLESGTNLELSSEIAAPPGSDVAAYCEAAGDIVESHILEKVAECVGAG